MSATPLYERVVADVVARIEAGLLKPGERLPSIAALASQHEVGTTTVKTALMMLRERGLVTGVPGKGVYVAARPADS